MIVQLTNGEFQKIRAFVTGVRNKELTSEFNAIFNDAARGGNSYGMTGVVIPSTNDIVITIPEATAMRFLSVFAKYSTSLGGIINNPNIGIMDAPRMLNLAQSFIQELVTAFT